MNNDTDTQLNTTKPIVDVMPTASSINTITPGMTTRKFDHHNKKKTLRIVAIVIGALAIIGIGVLLYRHYRNKHAVATPEQTLQDLKDSSTPVTATPKTRAADLKATEKQSAPVKTSVDDRQSMLNALK